MKKIILTLIIGASLISFSSNAQTNQSAQPKHSMENMKQMLKDSLQLTDVQVDSVTTIRQQSMGTMMSIRNDNSLTDDQKKQQMKDVRQQMKTRLETILTQDQMQKLQKMQREMHGGGKKMKDDNNQ